METKDRENCMIERMDEKDLYKYLRIRVGQVSKAESVKCGVKVPGEDEANQEADEQEW